MSSMITSRKGHGGIFRNIVFSKSRVNDLQTWLKNWIRMSTSEKRTCLGNSFVEFVAGPKTKSRAEQVAISVAPYKELLGIGSYARWNVWPQHLGDNEHEAVALEVYLPINIWESEAKLAIQPESFGMSSS